MGVKSHRCNKTVEKMPGVSIRGISGVGAGRSAYFGTYLGWLGQWLLKDVRKELQFIFNYGHPRSSKREHVQIRLMLYHSQGILISLWIWCWKVSVSWLELYQGIGGKWLPGLSSTSGVHVHHYSIHALVWWAASMGCASDVRAAIWFASLKVEVLIQRAELQTLLRNVLLNVFIVTSCIDLQYYKGKCILGIDITLFHHDSIWIYTLVDGCQFWVPHPPRTQSRAEDIYNGPWVLHGNSRRWHVL